MYRISEFADKCGVNKERSDITARKKFITRTSPNGSWVIRTIHMMTLSVLGLLNDTQELGFSLSEIYSCGVVDKDGVRCQDMFEFVF